MLHGEVLKVIFIPFEITFN